MLEQGLTVSLGADGAPCNNTLDIFQEMRLAAIMQKPIHGPTAMTAKTVMEMATLGGAGTLGIANEIGSIEAGKKADMVLLDLQRVWNPAKTLAVESVYSSIVYSGSPENVSDVMIAGRWVKRNGRLVAIDEESIFRQASEDLRLLLQRVQ
jgi:cytosine/adenosine deaminase-related metal-dependent hydrolase